MTTRANDPTHLQIPIASQGAGNLHQTQPWNALLLSGRIGDDIGGGEVVRWVNDQIGVPATGGT